MGISHRFAAENDLDLLAEWNHQLIRDEGHRNTMAVAQLRDRMAGGLVSDYKAILFERDNAPVAYALYRERDDEIYLRQLFVAREYRGLGIGRQAVDTLRSDVWPKGRRLTVDVLVRNEPAVRFWRSVGYSDYCLTLEIMA
ncbi:MAG: GNAT family N-acetyltransferase [FCB group bacterium]|jgi:GNAT superfamily N-acetyltransferase|nr:GNAT family N-acetyltransferase [FCB group bacterium]